jgi:glycosyltransferase involved in cell wall biosynthesis
MSAAAAQDVFVSVIVPVRNVSRQIETMLSALDGEARTTFSNYEIILVDDASIDDTVDVITELQKRMDNLQLYCLGQASGYDVAVVAGLDHCIGDFVAVLNLEIDPFSLLATMWGKIQSGCELVCGVRKDRVRGGLRAYLNVYFYKIFNSVTGAKVPIGIASPRFYSRKVVTYISRNKDRHLLVKILPFFSVHKIDTVEYEVVERGKWFGEQSLISACFTGITILLGSSARPLRIFTTMAISSSAISLLYALYVLGVSIFNHHVVAGWISLALPMAVISFFVSTLLGIISEYVFILAQQSGNRPPYLIVKESTSSVLEIRRKLNVVERSGDFTRHDPDASA